MRGGFTSRIGWGASRIVLACALALLAVAVAPAAAAARRDPRSALTCQHANASVHRAPTEDLRAAVLCLINKVRAAHGLPALRAAQALNRSAQGWTNAMIAGRFFSHGSNFAARISAAGLTWSSAGENIATGFQTPREVVDAWMSSTGHCENILSPSFRDVGTGVSGAGVPGYGSAGTWTQDFALPMGQRAPSGNWRPADDCPY